jgi:hypothetical protein
MMNAADILVRRKEVITTELDSLLRATAFDNPYSLHPRRLAEIGAQQVACLHQFLEAPNPEAAAALGGRLAKDGLGERTILKLAARLRILCRRELSAEAETPPGEAEQTLDAVEAFTTSVLEGYVGAWKAELLGDQERLRKAVADAIAGS